MNKKNRIFYSLYIGINIGVITYLFKIGTNKKKNIFPMDKIHYLIFHKIGGRPIESKKENFINDIIYVDVCKAIKDDSPITFDSYGTLIGAQEYPIVFDTSGKIIFVQDSKFVKKGEVYISLDSSQLQWKKNSYNAQLIAKKNYLKRLQPLHKAGIVAITQVEEIKKDIIALESSIEEINIQIGSMVLIAPVDGYFFLKNNASSPGISIQSRQELGYFFSHKKQIKFQIPHNYLLKTKNDEKIKVLFFPDFNGSYVEGSLNFNLKYIRPMSSSENDHNPQLCEGVADLVNDDNVSPMFYNQSGKIRVIFNEPNDYYLIPEVAVIHRGTKFFIYIVQDNRAILTNIEPLGVTGNGYLQIKKEEIGENTFIVYGGQNQLSHMKKVIVNQEI